MTTRAMRNVVIVGAGMAGFSAAAELRRQGWDGRLVVIGAETHRPYRRPPLSKEYLLQEAPASVRLPDADGLEAEWLLGSPATGLDVRHRTVLIGDRRVAFDGLVIASGVAPRPAPPHLAHPGVLVLRTVGDAVVLRRRLATSRHVLILGAGFLGSEIASAATSLGRSVTLVERGPQPMVGAVGDRIGRHVADLHRGHGVDLRLGREVTDLTVTPGETRARLDDGSVVAPDLVVAALGARPATGWLRGSGLVLDDGVVLGHDGLAAPGIAAAGDVARSPHPLLDGRLVRVEHYSNAADQGARAARALLGTLGPDAPAPVPAFWSHLYGRRLQSVGFTGSDLEYRTVDEDPSGHILGEYRRNGRLVGAITTGSVRALPRYRRRLATGTG
ncbi:NAD(P)/FAD-dependent oxidoreductase [Actinomadura sp. 3N407]|uniref:NAD(P)/FAD-dependent oxidoreductase n=1 Tax=Actinomadura sp. 3N407 TaxID=3457423 RepID=UPI003FCC80B3